MTIETKIAKNGNVNLYTDGKRNNLERLAKEIAAATIPADSIMISGEKGNFTFAGMTKKINEYTGNVFTCTYTFKTLDGATVSEEIGAQTPAFVAFREIIKTICNIPYGSAQYTPAPKEDEAEATTVEVEDYAVSTEVQEVAVKAETKLAQAQTAPTIVFNEKLFDNFKFEAGRTYFRLNEDGTPFTLKVEARTAHMLTGTTSEGTRKYKIGTNELGEYVQTDKDDDGYTQFIRARTEFIPAIVEIAKVKQEAFNVWAGKTPNDDTDPEGNDNQPAAELTEAQRLAAQIVDSLGGLIVKFNFANYGKKDELILHYETFKDANDEFSTPINIVEVFTDKRNYTLDHVNIINGYGDDKKVSTYYFKAEDFAVADREIEIQDELDHLENELFDAGGEKSIAAIEHDEPAVKRLEIKIAEINKRIDKLTNEWNDLTARYVEGEPEEALATQYTAHKSELPPTTDEKIIRLHFNSDEALDAKKILKPLANKACVELGKLTLGKFDNSRKICEVLAQVFGSANEIEKFKTLLANRIIIDKANVTPTDNKNFQPQDTRAGRLDNILKFPCGDFNPVKTDSLRDNKNFQLNLKEVFR